VTSLAAWAIYLFGYELLFRGFLIFGIAPIVGPWTAIAISTGLYTLAHLEKDFSETAGCVPFGIAMGVLSSWSGSFLAPWLVHFAVAAVAETLVISSRARHETGLHATTKV
jgi:membrane protease YdiL (CAAX protease family)